MRILVQDDNGNRVDVTEAVQILWDNVEAISSGSGFFDTEELGQLGKLKDATGFEEMIR